MEEEEMSGIVSRPSFFQIKVLSYGFRLIAIYVFLIGVITITGQIAWHIEGSQFSVFELEICFGIYGLFLASTSYYLSQIQASSWAQFLQVVSGIGIVLDIAIILYHALSPLKIDKNTYLPLTDVRTTNKLENLITKSRKNDQFMISMAALQAFGNLVAIYFCRIILRGSEIYWRERSDDNEDTKESTVGLLK